uniref:Solute carrier family 17 member 4 n=1 Tax=Catagonus wagneri TaxID=51154 RepID=A0A8C3WG79_9CETA
INMSIALPAMVNNTAPPTLLNASIERPPTESQDNWNETLKEVKAVDSPPGWSLPIKPVIKSLPLWSILVFSFTEDWHCFVMASYTPTYISSVLKVNIRDSGILSALPYLSGCICIVLGGLLADFLLSRNILRLNTIRKLFTLMGKNGEGRGGYGILREASYSLCVCSPAPGVFIPSTLCVCLFWVRSSFSATMTFLILSFAFKSLAQSGALINFMDIAPR